MTHPPARCTALCSGKQRPERAGKRCTNPPMAGQDVCRMHGGANPKAKAKAAERVQEDAMRRLLDDLDVQPVDNPLAALADVAGLIRGWMIVARRKVAELEKLESYDDKGTEQVKAAVAVFERAMDRAASVLATMVRLGLAERVVALDERTAAELIDLLRAVRDDADLGLTPSQKIVFFPAVQRARAAHPELAAG